MALIRDPSRVSEIGVGLDVRIFELLQTRSVRAWLAFGDSLEFPLGVVALCIGHGIANGQVDGFDVNVVLEDDDALVGGRVRRRRGVGELGGGVEDALEGGLVRDGLDGSGVNAPVLTVPLDGTSTWSDTDHAGGPDDGTHTHCEGNGTDTIVHVTIRRTEGERGDANDVPDSLASPSEFRDNLLVCQGGQGTVTPGVDRNLVIVHVFVHENLGPANHTSTDDIKGGLDTRSDTSGDVPNGGKRVEISQELVGVESWTIIVIVTPIPLVLALGHVRITQATTACPPAVSTLPRRGESGRVCGITAIDGRVYGNVGDVVALEFPEPFRDFWRVCGWCQLKVWPRSWYDRVGRERRSTAERRLTSRSIGLKDGYQVFGITDWRGRDGCERWNVVGGSSWVRRRRLSLFEITDCSFHRWRMITAGSRNGHGGERD